MAPAALAVVVVPEFALFLEEDVEENGDCDVLVSFVNKEVRDDDRVPGPSGVLVPLIEAEDDD